MTPMEARLLLKSQVRDSRLIKHSMAMEAIMSALADELGEDKDTWALVGLLHDIDLPQTYKNPEKHGLIAGEILDLEHCDMAVIDAVKAHSGNAPRDSILKNAIYAAEAALEFIEAVLENHPVDFPDSLDNKFFLDVFYNDSMLKGFQKERLNSCEKLGWTIEEFFGKITCVLTGMKFYIRAVLGRR